MRNLRKIFDWLWYQVRQVKIRDLVIIGLLIFAANFLFNKEKPVVIPGHKPDQSIVLQENEKEIIGVVGNKITVAKRGKDGKVETETKYVPPDGGAKIAFKKDGSVEVRVKNKGLSASPGLSLLYADSLRAGIDLNLAYWNRLGISMGVGLGRHPVAVPFAAVNYSWGNVRFRNTALMVGYTTRKTWLVGVRVRF